MIVTDIYNYFQIKFIYTVGDTEFLNFIFSKEILFSKMYFYIAFY